MKTDLTDAVKNNISNLAIFIMGNWNADENFTDLTLKRKEVVTILNAFYELYDGMDNADCEIVDGIIQRISKIVNTKKNENK